MRNTTASLSMN